MSFSTFSKAVHDKSGVPTDADTDETCEALEAEDCAAG